ncbi:MAG: hypothetical protein ACW99A_06135 [Candidatus Kariarchaeaceae archaeon]|jgi:hypothetical protein
MTEEIQNGRSGIQGLKKYVTKKNFILTVTLVSFIGSIIYMQIGSSDTTRFETTEGPIFGLDNPQVVDVPNRSDQNVTGGFNLTENFEDLPRFDIPGDIVADLPKHFGSGGSYGGLPNITKGFDPGQLTDPGNGGSIINIPTITTPSNWNTGGDIRTGGNTLTTGGTATAGDGVQTDQPIFTDIVGSKNQRNVTLQERSDKARNLPTFAYIDLSFLNLDFLNISKISLSIKTNSMLFLAFLIMPVIVMNKVVPNFINRLHEFDENKGNIDSLFVMPKGSLAALRRRKERVRRLLVFKDHVDELIERSKIRIEKKTPSHTIIIGYHELDKAFSEFSSLIRTKDITPLEHANMHFETGEIENKILEKIVELFYLTRFATREITKKDGHKFIDYLNNLVVDKSILTEKLKSLEIEIKGNSNNN